MLLFYCGTDTYRMHEAVRALVDRYLTKHGRTNLFMLDTGDADDRSELERTLKNRPFLPEPTFAIASNTFDDADTADLLMSLITKTDVATDPDLVLLVRQGGSRQELRKKRAKLFTLLTAKAKESRIFEPLTGTKIIAWMQAYCRDRGCTLAPPDASHMLTLVGPETWALSNELAKLCAWTESGRIERTSIERLVVPSRMEANVFALTDAVSGRNKRAVLMSLERQLHAGADEHYLLAMYAFAVRNLLTIKDLAERGLAPAAIAQQGGLHPFVVKKNMAGARMFGKTELLRAHSWLARADQATKDGSWDARDALYDFVLSVL